ncbi:hypothetical protein HII31_03288, partial [Pseudocercospora fuligena]
DLAKSKISPTPLCRKRKATDDIAQNQEAAEHAGSMTPAIRVAPTIAGGQIEKLAKELWEAQEKATRPDALEAQQLPVLVPPPPPIPAMDDTPGATSSQVIDLTDDDVEIKQEPMSEEGHSSNKPTAIEDDQDEEDLELELKKIEIQQKLKAMRKKNKSSVVVKKEG